MSHDLGQRDDVAGADDLTQIEGIGPRRAERLKVAGICNYAGLASSSVDDIAKVLPDVGHAKIGAWRDKARELAGTARPREDRPPPAEADGAQAGLPGERPASSAVLSVERTPLRAAEPFTLTMAIELAEPASHADRLAYSAVVVARPLTGGPNQTVAKSDGVLAATSSAISIDATGLPPGAYRLDGAVSLRERGAGHPVHLAGIAEGLLVHVLPR